MAQMCTTSQKVIYVDSFSKIRWYYFIENFSRIVKLDASLHIINTLS